MLHGLIDEFLGINIQYRNESGTLKVYTVGIVETFQDHTGEYLLEELKNTLLKFDIELSQIYSVTIDNGANMVKMCRLLNEYLSSKTCSYDESVDDTADPSSSTHGRNEEEDEEYFLAGIEEHEVTAFYEHQERVVESMEIHLKIDDVVPSKNYTLVFSISSHGFFFFLLIIYLIGDI